MSEDFVQLPIEGAGKKLRAIKRVGDLYEEVNIPVSLDNTVDLKSIYDKLVAIKDVDGIKKIQDAITAVISGTPDVNVTDRVARLLGIVYGNIDQLQQKVTTKELLAWVNNFPTDYPDASVLAKLDVALSTRLKIADFVLTQELGKVGIILTTGGTIIDPRSIRALTSSDIVSLVSNDLKTIRWGITREPTWTDGVETTAPAAGATLVTKTVTAAMTGRVFGVHISADEANQFQLLVDAVVIKRFALGGAGVIHIVLATPLKDDITASAVITIKNVTIGTAGKVYQASLLYDEA